MELRSPSMIEWLLAVMIMLLILIYSKLTDIYDKMTERQRVKEKRDKERTEAFYRRSDLGREAWAKLSPEDQARFNDFHYEHAIGKISDADYEAMKRELHEKTNGLCD